MLVGLPLMDVVTQTVQAQEYLFTINLVVAYEAEGYWDIASAFKAELAKIGINVELQYMDAGTYYDVVWDVGWNKTWDDGGWDMDFSSFWWMPTDLVWYEGCYSWAAHPPYGWNYFGWHNDEADKQLRLCMSTLDPGLRKEYIWKWQAEAMRDPPHITIYYPTWYEIRDADLEGWDWIRWWWDTDDLKFAGTTLEDDVTLNYGTVEDLRSLNPLFTLSIGSETFTDQVFDMLMKTSTDPVTGKAILKPSLAREPPVYSPDGMSATVYLRENVTWHDGWKFNATDVKFTFDAVIDPNTWCSGYGDFAPVIDWTEIVDEFTVKFHFKEPAPHFDTLLADDYGALIVPWHILRDVPHGNWRRDSTNIEAPMPGTGRWIFDSWDRGEQWVVKANKDYFLGESLIDEIYNIVITDPSAGLIALQSHQIDFGDCWTATRDEIDDMRGDLSLKVTDLPYPSVQYLGFNLHHPILSNMYVRYAIAHAIPYEHIITDLLPNLGMSGVRATGPITPEQGYFYNTELVPFEYDLAIARKYLDMWKYSLPEYTGTPKPIPPPPYNPNTTLVAKGPVGDGDLTGFVDADDYVEWADRIVYDQRDPEDWPFPPPIDPDYDNTGLVDIDDFTAWQGVPGATYHVCPH